MKIWTRKDMFRERTWNLGRLRVPHHYGRCRMCHPIQGREARGTRRAKMRRRLEDERYDHLVQALIDDELWVAFLVCPRAGFFKDNEGRIPEGELDVENDQSGAHEEEERRVTVKDLVIANAPIAAQRCSENPVSSLGSSFATLDTFSRGSDTAKDQDGDSDIDWELLSYTSTSLESIC